VYTDTLKDSGLSDRWEGEGKAVVSNNMRAAEVKLNFHPKQFCPEEGSSIFIRTVGTLGQHYECCTVRYSYTASQQVSGQTVSLPLPLYVFLQATVLYAAPPIVLFLASHPGVLPKYLQSLRHVGCGAAPLGGPDAERFLKRASPNTNIAQGSMLTLYLTNLIICFLPALVVLTWPARKPTRTAGIDKRYSSNKITTLYMLYTKTCR
jgi:hypothetical protein